MGQYSAKGEDLSRLYSTQLPLSLSLSLSPSLHLHFTFTFIFHSFIFPKPHHARHFPTSTPFYLNPLHLSTSPCPQPPKRKPSSFPSTISWTSKKHAVAHIPMMLQPARMGHTLRVIPAEEHSSGVLRIVPTHTGIDWNEPITIIAGTGLHKSPRRLIQPTNLPKSREVPRVLPRVPL
jgi:hypothetical protein